MKVEYPNDQLRAKSLLYKSYVLRIKNRSESDLRSCEAT